MSGPTDSETVTSTSDRRRRRWAAWGVAAAGVVAVALFFVPDLLDGPAATVAPSPTPEASGAIPTTTAPSVAAPTTTASAAAPAALPPLEQRWFGDGPITSDTPLADDELQDGAFVALVRSVDAQARTITADVVIFYGGDDARAAAAAREPGDAGEVVSNGFYVVNDVERERVLKVAPDARVGVWCFDGGRLRTVELAFDQWAVPSEVGETTACGVRGWPLPDLYWLDVRSGLVVQVTEQYTP